MMVQGVSLSEMLNQSITVLTKPSVQSFEQYEKRGGVREGFIYVGVAAAVAAIVAALFGLLGGILGALIAGAFALIGPLIGYAIFSYVLYFVGKQQGGTGTQDEVFYSTALYVAPLLAVVGIVSNIPIIGCLALPVTLALGIYQIYLGYLVAKASMNLDQNKAIISVVAAYAAQFVVGLIIAGISTAILLGGAAASGALNQ